MNVNFAEVKAQVDQLPISYYAKRKIPMSVSKDEKTSYYNATNDEIVISYPIIAEGLKNAPDSEGEEYKETAIRGMVYHELSHAILTPDHLYQHFFREDAKIANLFEDERIETLLADFYMNVNFKKLLLYTNGGKITAPTNAFEAFYNLVRFRVGDDDLLEKVEKIIYDARNINGSTSYGASAMYTYVNEVDRLWNEVKKRWKKNGNTVPPQNYSDMENAINGMGNSEGYSENDVDGKRSKNPSDNQQGNGEGEGNSEGKGKGKEKAEGEGSGQSEGEGNGQNEGEGEGNSEGDGEGDGKGEGEGKDGTNPHNEGEQPQDDGISKATKRLKGGQFGGKTDLKDIERNFQKSTNRYNDSKITETYKGIIDMFSKKNNSGNGCTGYSGIFNPRNIRNNDYKFFDRKVTAKGNNKFGKFHLNLFVDNSGSFDGLAPYANTIIRSLTEVERKNPNFDFDLILCDSNLHDTDKKKRFIKADGGTYAEYEEVNDMMKKHTKKDSYNYNIVMYDGGVGHPRNKNPFLAWDRNNVTVIDTGDNKSDINEMKNARVVITSYGNLVNQLADEVAKSLRIAFR